MMGGHKKNGKIRFRPVTTMLISIAAVLAVLWIIVSAQADGLRSKSNAMTVGSQAPDFTATTTSGLPASLSAYRGKIVLINFWASYCTPCVREMPLIHQLLQSRNSEIASLFINIGETKGTVRAFMEEHQFAFPVIIDTTGKISKQYGIIGLPATFIIDENGNISKIVQGEVQGAASLLS